MSPTCEVNGIQLLTRSCLLVGLSEGDAKCHRKILCYNIQGASMLPCPSIQPHLRPVYCPGIRKPAIRRLARCGAMKRISGLIYEETCGVLKIFLEIIIRDSVTYNEQAKR